MVVHHARRLHERITDRRSDKTESAFPEVLTHRVGFGSRRRNLLQRFPAVQTRASADELPDVAVEGAELGLDREKCRSVGNRRFDLDARRACRTRLTNSPRNP